MSFTSYATAVAGSVFTAAWLNTYVRDNGNVLKISIDDNGHINWLTVLKSGNYTLTPADDIVFVSATSTQTLPPSPVVGKPYTIKAGSAATVTVAGNGHNIDGAATFIVNPYDAFTFIYNGTEFNIF